MGDYLTALSESRLYSVGRRDDTWLIKLKGFASKERPARKPEKITAICERIV
jgi:hypothetical protein